MRDPTYFCVQAFCRSGGRLVSGRTSYVAGRKDARRSARKLASQAAGAVAYEFEGRPEFGIIGEPRLIAAHGEVPGD